MSYNKDQAQWLEDYKIVKGVKVRVKSLPKPKEKGWGNDLSPNMESSVGQVLTFKHSEGSFGNYLSDGYHWPYFCLERVETEQSPDWWKHLTIGDHIESLVDVDKIRKKGRVYKIVYSFDGYIWYKNDEKIISCTDKFEEFKLV